MALADANKLLSILIKTWMEIINWKWLLKVLKLRKLLINLSFSFIQTFLKPTCDFKIFAYEDFLEGKDKILKQKES